MATTLRRAILGLALAAAVAAAGWFLLGREVPRPGASPAAESPPVRGGELIASLRSEPASYNRYVPAGGSAATDYLTLLTQARLARVNRSTDELEPWLAESWTRSADGLTYTVKLRPDLRFSDGVPLTSADVLFSFRAAYDQTVHSPLAPALMVQGKPLAVSAPDAATVVITFPAPFAPGLRLLDNLPVLPRHRLEGALNAGTFAEAWTPATPVTDVVGLGPFVLVEHVSGQRIVLARNPHYFRRDASGVQLPYLDRLTLAIVPDQAAEALRLQAGETDLMTNGDIRPEDFAAFKRLSDQGRLRVIDAGIGLDPDFLWFNLTAAKAASGQAPWLQDRTFRQAISFAVDRDAIVNGVYLGAAVPIFGPVSPGNTRWFSPGGPEYRHDPGRARQLLASMSIIDRDGDGMVEDARGTPVRFSMLSQAGHIRGRTAAVIQEHLRKVGIAVDLVPLDPGGIFQRWSRGDYDSIYFGLQASSTDPALNSDFWLSSGQGHFWNAAQAMPATPWERRIDDLMHEQAAASNDADRRRAFAEVQRIMGEELPAIYFVAPRTRVAISARVQNPTPVPQLPQLLWSADTLAVHRPSPGR